jgi:uncharacterized membrane protein YkvA (DUF1232 family)
METAMASKSELEKEIKKNKEKIQENKKAINGLTKEQAILAEREIAKQILTVLSTALAVVSALFWQAAINDMIKTFIPVSGVWTYEIVVAMLVTMIAAMIIVTIHRKHRANKNN